MLSNTQLAELGKEMSDLSALVSLLQRRDEAKKSIADLRGVENEERAKGSDGEEMAELASSERELAEQDQAEVENQIVKLLTPKDKDDDRNIILEVRAGTGNII